METDRSPYDLLDYLEVGLSAITWHPEDLSRSEWIFVNAARCRMTGFSREELLSLPPFSITSQETIDQTETIIAQVSAEGQFTSESILLHRSNRAIPVVMHMKLIKQDRGEFLLIEHHDIRSHKEAEARLNLARETTREILTLIDKEKQQLSKNIEGNLGLVTFPLIDQLRITATSSQKSLLDLLEDRIRHVTRELGITSQAGAFGANLTRRQILICEMIREGLTSKVIAGALGCASSTINNHRNIIRKKLGLSGKSANLQAFLNSVPVN